MGMHLMGMHLMGVHLMGVYLTAQIMRKLLMDSGQRIHRY
jgi:hypothetical protein